MTRSSGTGTATPPTALVLTAGLGSRLKPWTDDRPKCLVEVAGHSLLETMLGHLVGAGIQDCVVVAGHRLAQVRDALVHVRAPLRTHVVEAPDYAATGTAASARIGLSVIGGDVDVLLIEGDVIFESEVLSRTLRSPRSATVVATGVPGCSGTMLSVDRDGRVLGVHHATWDRPPGAVRLSKCVNIHLFGRRDVWGAMVRTLDSLLARDPTAHIEHLVQAVLAGGTVLRAVEVGDLRWWEVDDPVDLERAEQLFGAEPSGTGPARATRRGG